MMNKIILSACLMVLIPLQNNFSQSGGSVATYDARSTAMAKTYTASSFGLFSLGVNPANLNYKTSKNFEMILPLPVPSISGHIGTNFLSIDEYNYFFGESRVDENGKKIGRYLTESDKQRLKNLFTEGGIFTSNIYVKYLGFSVRPSEGFGTLAFSISDNIAGSVTFPKGIIEIGLEGNPEGSVYNFNDTQLKAWWLRKYSFSYATKIVFSEEKSSAVSLGFSLNFIKGYFYTGIDEIKTELKTGANNVVTGNGRLIAYSAFSPDFGVKYDFDDKAEKRDFNFSTVPEPAGTGIGVDFGLNYMTSPYISFAFALTDLGSLKWTKNVAEFKSNKAIYLDDISNKEQRDSLTEALTGKESGKYINELKTNLASVIRAGVLLHADKYFNLQSRMLIALDYNQGLNDQPGNSKKPRFSIGIDWSPANWILALRSGFSVGGIDKFNWGFGFGLDFNILELNFGTPDFQYLFSPSSAKRITFAIDSRWKF